MWYIHITKYFLTIKRNEVLIYATTWVDLENIMLRGKKPVTKDSKLPDPIYMKHPE